MMKQEVVLSTNELRIGYRHGKVEKHILDNLNIELLKGELVCLLGSNGSGKSTLIRSLAGLQPVFAGTVLVGSEQIDSTKLSSLERARFISMVLTEQIEAGHITVYALIALGRYPYTAWTGKLSEQDQQVIDEAIKATGLTAYVNRFVAELSDGEKQKVMIARALAQECPLLFLDEPTAYLDVPSKVETMQLLKKLAKSANKAILVSTHDLDMALQTADRIWLLNSNGSIVSGLPEDLVLNGDLEIAFNRDQVRFDKRLGRFKLFQNQDHLANLNVEGDKTSVSWTKKALERVDQLQIADISKIETTLSNGSYQWFIHKQDKVISCDSIESLITHLQ